MIKKKSVNDLAKFFVNNPRTLTEEEATKHLTEFRDGVHERASDDALTNHKRIVDISRETKKNRLDNTAKVIIQEIDDERFKSISIHEKK